MTAVVTKHKGMTTLIAVVVAALVAVLCSSLLPIEVGSGSSTPSIADINKHRSIGLNGDSFLPVINTVLTSASEGPFATPVVHTVSSVVSSGVAVLGAPSSTAPVALAGCGWAALICDAGRLLYHVGAALVTCSATAVGLVFAAHACLSSLKHILGDLAAIAMWQISRTIEQMAQTFAVGMQKEAMGFASWVLNDLLSGKNTLTEPTISCQNAQAAVQSANCKDAFILGQYNIMRQIALFMLGPLFMLVVIESIIRGSLYMLVRATFVMLPTAALGMVAVVYLVQILLNLSDDFVSMISTYTTSTTEYASQFTATVSGMDVTKINWYAVVWMFMLTFAVVVIYFELLLRQVGVYLAVMFLPLAFASLVWPAIAGFAKKVFEWLLGLIFSKVFIAAAISLGIEAFASSSMTGTNTLPGGLDNATSAGLTSLVSGTLIFIMAAFAGTRVIAMTPAAVTAAEGRVGNPSALWGKFQLANAGLSRMANWQNRRNNNRGSGRLSQFFNTHINGNGFRNQDRTPWTRRPRPADSSGAAPGRGDGQRGRTPAPPPGTQRRPRNFPLPRSAWRSARGRRPGGGRFRGRNYE